MAAATKSVAVLILLNLAVLTIFVSTANATCPDLSACVNLLGLAKLQVGSQVGTPCCKLIDGIVDLDATVCLCSQVKTLLGSLLGGLGGLLGPVTSITDTLLDTKVLLLLNACNYSNYPTNVCA